MSSDDKNPQERLKLLIVGVGGQGVLLISRVLGDAALAENLNVVVGQLHGMSQRGGSVSSTVLIGPGYSSFIGKNQADVVIGLEPLEVMRALPFMSDKTTILMNTGRIVPYLLSHQGKQYPELSSIKNHILAVTSTLHEIDGRELPKTGPPSSTVREHEGILSSAKRQLNNLPTEDAIMSQQRGGGRNSGT